MIREWIDRSGVEVTVLSPNLERAEQVLSQLQVTTRSPLGAIAYYTGGLLVDHGWVRILGGGNDTFLRDLLNWNAIDVDSTSRLENCILIADDVIGGFFAINGGQFSGEAGEVFYFAPDTLEWEGLGVGYTEFIQWILCGDLNKFYEEFRWEGWEQEVSSIRENESMLVYPFLWAEGPKINHRSKKVVPVEELWDIRMQNKDSLS